jgi:hypothetical protein
VKNQHGRANRPNGHIIKCRPQPGFSKDLVAAFSEWIAGQIYVCKRTGKYRYRFGAASKSVAPWSGTAEKTFTSPIEFASAAEAYAKAQGWNTNAKPRPANSPKAANRNASAPRVNRVPKIPKNFADFLASRCKNLALAAKVLGIAPKPPLQKAAVRAAWISLVRIHHPDKGGALEAAQAVNAAYQLLEKFSQ